MFIGLVSCFVHACLRLLSANGDSEKRDDGCLKWFGSVAKRSTSRPEYSSPAEGVWRGSSAMLARMH